MGLLHSSIAAAALGANNGASFDKGESFPRTHTIFSNFVAVVCLEGPQGVLTSFGVILSKKVEF